MNDETNQPGSRTVADGGTRSLDALEASMNDTEGRTSSESDETMPEETQEFLLEAVRRAPLLLSLRSEPADPGNLLRSVDTSRSTLHRAIKSLQKLDVVEESNGKYELTTLGEVLAKEVETFGARACTASSLDQFLNSIELNGSGFPVEHFVDADVTQRESRQPHTTIHRIIKLIETSESLRMFSTVISPVHVDVGYREMMNGMKIEAIFDHEVVDIMLSEFPEKAQETIAIGNFDVYAHDGLPFELFLFDDKVGMAAHNKNGNAEVLVECDDPSAIEWAENLYSKHLSKAEPLMKSDS